MIRCVEYYVYLSLVESSGGNQLARSSASEPTCETAGHAKTRTTSLPAARRAHLVKTRTPWVQHTLARDAPSLHPNLLFLPNGSQSPLESGNQSLVAAKFTH